MGTAYFFEQEVSIFSDIVLKLKQETFRRGTDWQPLFVKKCITCDQEYQEEVDECECGSVLLREPEQSHTDLFELDGVSFEQRANFNGQSLKEVLSDVEFNLDVADNAYLLISKSYVISTDGQIMSSAPKEILSIDPRDIRKIHSDNGMPGGNIWICPEHREASQASEAGKTCHICGADLQEAYFETAGVNKLYYIKDEILHVSKFYPSILYGYPPILKMFDDAMAYHYLEKRTRSYYEKGRVPGIMMIPTNNAASLRAFWDETMLRVKDDPYYMPIIGYGTDTKSSASFVKMLEDPNINMLEVKKELRERIGSRFGVSLIFQGDTSASGGLNNEGLQITVTNRAIEDGQMIYNGKVLPWICKQFGITDYVLQLNPNEEQDEMAEKERLARDISNARQMWEIGFDIEYSDGTFEFTGKAKPSESGSGSFFPMNFSSDRITGEPEDVEKSMLTKGFVDNVLKAIKNGALYQHYESVSEDDVDTIHSILKDGIVNKLSTISIADSISSVTGLDPARSEMIARTEKAAVSMSAREIGWRDEEERRGESFKFKVVTANDERTSNISKWIEARVQSEGGAVTLDRMKQIYKEESTKPVKIGGMGPEWKGWKYFIAHPNERSTVVRVV